jgi:hypothetical protein
VNNVKKLIRHSKGKRKAQIKHAKKGLLSRFDMAINDNEYLQMINKIKKGRAVFVRRTSKRVTIWDVPIREKVLRCVYDKSRQVIVTVLPVYGLEKNLEPIGERIANENY